ncbi:histidinol dehydrogenase [soil metagenome]
MIRIVSTQDESVESLLQARTISRDSETEMVVRTIIDDVANRGDLALLESGRRFDCPTLSSLLATDDRVSLSDIHADALLAAADRILRFHQTQFSVMTSALVDLKWQMPGLADQVGQRLIPLSRVGVYVPGGRATYPSSVLMNALPAVAAGVKEIVICSPASSDGRLADSVLTAVDLVGASTTVVKVGGAAAIAAMALGTESVPKVDKIVGPGNRFVNEAKRQLWGRVGLDGYAGPSEVAVLADDSANATFAAADLLTQIEHAPDNAAFLICVSRGKLDAILGEVERLLIGSSHEDVMRAALTKESLAILARDLDEACDLVNLIAPEHLTLMVKDDVSGRIVNAGCILMGDFTPESAADWVIGPSHTLPTSRAARFGSPVNVLDFLKVQSLSRLSAESLAALQPTIDAVGEMEGFEMHALAARLRSM